MKTFEYAAPTTVDEAVKLLGAPVRPLFQAVPI